MKASLPKLLALLVLAFLGVVRLSAQYVVNVNFHENHTSNYSGQGAVSDVGNNYWNSVTELAGGTNFTASDGTTATTISFSATTPHYATGVVPSFSTELFHGYLYITGTTPSTFTISGLTAGLTYQFYLYGESGTGGSDRPVTFVLNGVTQFVTGVTTGSFTNGSNYTVYSVTPSGTTVTGSFVGTNSGNEANFNGLQIVVPIPEASTYAMLVGAMSLAGAMFVHRRRKSCVVSG